MTLCKCNQLYDKSSILDVYWVAFIKKDTAFKFRNLWH